MGTLSKAEADRIYERIFKGPSSDRLLTVHEAAEVAGRSRSQLYVDIKCGLMPPPIRRGKSARWPADEIYLINIERQRLRTRFNPQLPESEIEAQIKELVARLVRSRSEPELPSDETADSRCL